MEYFFNCQNKISKSLGKSKKVVLMFDFDGTLSAIAPTPQQAFIKKSTKNLLRDLIDNYYVAVISGRTLKDVKSKVGLHDLIYAGSHGAEWQIGNIKKGIKISKKDFDFLNNFKKEIKLFLKKYKGSFVENKLSGFVVHYRLINKKYENKFLQELEEIIFAIRKDKRFLVVGGKKVIEIRQNNKQNKGTFVKFLLNFLKSKNQGNLIPLYIGDDITDEDVFRVLKNGITVRVEKKKDSFAKYFIKTNEIDRFLDFFKSLS